VVAETVLAYIEVARAGAAIPIVWLPFRQVLLKPVEPAIAVLPVRLDFAIDPFFAAVQGLHRAVAVVDDTQRAGKTELHCTMSNRNGVLRNLNSSASNPIYIDGQNGK